MPRTITKAKRPEISEAQRHAKEAARAHSNLNLFAMVVELLESGGLHGYFACAEQILTLAQEEQQRYLGEYDRHIAAIGNPA